MDDVIRTSLEVGDNASAPLKSAEEAAREYAQATGGLTDAEKRLLAQMLATQKKLEDRARVTGLAADQIRALERGVKQQAAAEAAAAAAAAASAKEVTANAIDSGKAMERAAQGGRVLQYQLMDITTQLAGGTNPLVILAQQGPDVAMAFQAGGGAAATFRAAMAPLTGALSAGALILPPLALAVAAVGTAYAVTTNHMESLIPTSQVVNDLLREQGSVAGQLSGELENTAGQWAKFTERMAATASEIERINTGLVNVAAAMAKAEGDVTTQGGRALLATSQRVAELRRLIAAEQDAQESGRLNLSETEKSAAVEAKYRRELEQQQALLVTRKAAFDKAKEQAAALAEYNAVLANEESRLADKTKQTTEATKAKAAAERAAAEWTREAMYANEVYYSRLQATLDAIQAGEDAAWAGATATDTAITRLIDKTNALAPPEVGTRLQQLNLLLGELETRASASAEANAQLKESIQQVTAARDAEALATQGTAGMGNQATQSLQGPAGAATALSAVAGGVGGIASAAGPYGAAVMAGLSLVQGLSPKEGEVGLIDQAQVFIDDLLTSLGQLPTAIMQQLADVDLSALSTQISETIESLLVGLTEALPTLIPFILELFLRIQIGLLPMIIQAIPAVVDAVIEVFGDPDTWREMAQAMLEAIKSVFRDTFGGAADRVGARNTDLLGRLPGRGGGGGMNVTVNGVVGDTREVIRTFRDRLGSLGSGLSFERDGRWSA